METQFILTLALLQDDLRCIIAYLVQYLVLWVLVLATAVVALVAPPVARIRVVLSMVQLVHHLVNLVAVQSDV